MACSIVRSFKACMPPFSKAAKEDLRSKVELLLLLLPTALWLPISLLLLQLLL